MFAFFVNDEFKGFWSNKIGDIFVQATCSALRFSPSQTKVVFFHGLENVPEYFVFGNSNSLIIQEKVIIVGTSIDPETEQEITTETESFVDLNTIPADPFFVDGQSVKDC
jgi:hypothetical protein